MGSAYQWSQLWMACARIVVVCCIWCPGLWASSSVGGQAAFVELESTGYRTCHPALGRAGDMQ